MFTCSRCPILTKGVSISSRNTKHLEEGCLLTCDGSKRLLTKLTSLLSDKEAIHICCKRSLVHFDQYNILFKGQDLGLAIYTRIHILQE